MRNATEGRSGLVLARALTLLLVLVGPLLVVTSARASGTGTITGSVTVPAGYDVGAVSLFVRPVSGFMGYGDMDAWVDPDGTFSVSALAPGDYYAGFATYWSDMQPCSFNRDRWWSGPGEANGTCDGSVSGAVPVTVTDGGSIDLGSVPLLTTMPVHHYSGRLVAPPGHSAAGLKAEVWLSLDGAFPHLPGGWKRLTSVPALTVGDDGAFSFDLIAPLGGNQLAIRVVDPETTGYAFSFGRGGLSADSTGQGGADFGAGAVGLLNLPWGAGVDYGSLQVKFPLGYVSGEVTLSGAPEWGRTLTAHSDVVWADPTVGTTYQWYRNGLVLDGAVGPSYVLNGLDDGWGSSISARAVPEGAWAYDGAPIESPALTIENTTPLNVSRPVVAGAAVFGRTLSASTGAWRPTYPTYTYSYQWYRGATPIPGAARSTYSLRLTDLGQRLSVEVRAARPPDCSFCSQWFTGPGSARSVPTRAVVPARMPGTWVKKWPRGLGEPRVRHRVRVTRPVLSTDGRRQHLTVRYQWYAAGKRLAGADRRSLRITEALRHRTITVRVSITKRGYLPRQRVVRLGRVP